MRRFVAVVIPVAFIISMPAAAHAASTLTVDDNLQCAGSTYTTISSAVTAATAGDTIKVCAGIYAETVNVTKTLTFNGAQAGIDGRSGRTALQNESVVNDLNGDFIIGGGVDGVTIDGFTIQGAGSASVGADGVEAFAGSSGLTLQNNVIQNNLIGINFNNADPTQPALIEHNRFVNNNNGTSPQGGTGVFISSGPANNTTILQNGFTGHRETAINFAGDSGNHSVGLVVEGNKSTNDETFVVAINSDNALIDANTVTFTAMTPNGTAMLDFGSNNDLRITDNTIKGGSTSLTTGIKLADFSGTSDGTTVTNNKVTGRYYGIRIQGADTTGFISHNTVTSSSQVGIYVEAGSHNLISRNNVKLSATLACQDDTTGTGTAGTANKWTLDKGNGSPSTPVGICS
jgi:parallel beta-helix repeat protein